MFLIQDDRISMSVKVIRLNSLVVYVGIKLLRPLHLRSGVQAPLADKPALRPLLPLLPRIVCAAVGPYFSLAIFFEQFLIQIAIGQVLQLLQSDAQVFAAPSPLSENRALQHAFRIVALPCNGAPCSHLPCWLRGLACASP